MTDRSVRPQQAQPAPVGWLLGAARDAAKARAEWKEQGVAVLECGRAWTAVRIPGELVYAAAGTDDPTQVGAYLAAGLRGPVFVHPRGRQYYVLTEPGTARFSDEPDVDCLRPGTYLGVPAPERLESNPDHDAYWTVPVGSSGGLCAGDDIARLVAAGRAALKAENEGGSHG